MVNRINDWRQWYEKENWVGFRGNRLSYRIVLFYSDADKIKNRRTKQRTAWEQSHEKHNYREVEQ